MKKLFISLLTAFALCTTASASVNIQQTQGWLESGSITWAPVAGATDYHVYVKATDANGWTALDRQLVRQYPDCYRADALGLKAGEYQFRIVPVDAAGEMTAEATESVAFTATAHDRSGFAHVGMSSGIGAYRNDGTLRADAQVLYVWAGNAKTVTHDVITSSKGAKTTGHGLQDIIYLYQKGYDSTPLAIRIIGTISDNDMDRFDSSAEGLQIKGKAEYSSMPLTIEGVGDDATLTGFGLLVRNCHGTEFRNFAIMLCKDDCLSLDTGNSNIWIHNMDFFYGNTGGDSDQAKGDGTVDVKGKTKNVTMSYCHFWDSGKSSLGGMKSETTSCWHTYHHNWFDHSDSRHPRVRTMFFHVYNNYFDGNAKYGVGMTMGGSALVEANVFRNCKYPMLISRQGTDAEGDGTFSGENGGVIKAFNNDITGAKKVQYYDGSQTDGKWDAVLVTSRDAEVKAKAYAGGTEYNNEADLAARTTYIENHLEEPASIVATITGELGAGRMNHGDFQWTFDNAVEDANYDVITALKSALKAYQPTVIGFADGTAISSQGSGEGEGGNPDDGGDNPGGENPGGDDDPVVINPIEGEVICHFSDKKPSSAMVTVSGNYSNSKGSVTYSGKEYSICVKMESATSISLAPTGDCNITLMFGSAETGKKLKIDEETYTTDAQGLYTFEATAGTRYELKKGDSINLFLIIFKPKDNGAGINAIADDDNASPAYNLFGRNSRNIGHGIYIINGQKILR